MYGKILLADDDETFLCSTSDLLRKEGYECDTALDAASAAEMISKTDYDLLIADIRMPGNSKLEFIKDIPRISEGMPVIIVTGYPSLDSAIKSIRLPVRSYLVKPIEFSQLLAQVRYAISKHRVYVLTRQIRRRLEVWVNDLLTLEEVARDTSKYELNMPADSILDLSLSNMANSLLDLKQLIEILAATEEKFELCRLLNCKRLTSLDVLGETIQVLERTRKTVKSRDLDRLCEKLKGVLQTQQRQ
ncbi:MAG: response regulator [Candidatus Glassbacteria bacterium]